MRSYFTPAAFKDSKHPFKDYKLWFPKLALKVRGDDGNSKTIAASNSGWHNVLEDEGTRITEYNVNGGDYKTDGKLRVTFVKYRDPLGIDEYKFVGVFQFHDKTEKEVHYKRIVTEIPIIKSKNVANLI